MVLMVRCMWVREEQCVGEASGTLTMAVPVVFSTSGGKDESC